LKKIFVEYFYNEKVFKGFNCLNQTLKDKLLGTLSKKGCIGGQRSTEIRIWLGTTIGGTMRGATAPSMRTKIEDNDIYPQP